MSRTWFITGCSTGFGKRLAKIILDRGEQLVATARNPATLEDLASPKSLLLPLDVTEVKARSVAVGAALAHFGRVDVLVNNAGYGMIGALEESPEAEIRRLFETNFFGLVELTRELLPQFRKNRRGHIFNISSVAGVVASPGFGIYNASKFAVEGLSEALAGEMLPLGVQVTLIEPGPFKTDFAGRSLVTTTALPDYIESSGRMRDYIHKMEGHQPGDPDKAAQAIWEISTLTHAPLRFVCGKIAVDRIRAKLTRELESLSALEGKSIATDF